MDANQNLIPQTTNTFSTIIPANPQPATRNPPVAPPLPNQKIRSLGRREAHYRMLKICNLRDISGQRILPHSSSLHGSRRRFAPYDDYTQNDYRD